MLCYVALKQIILSVMNKKCVVTCDCLHTFIIRTCERHHQRIYANLVLNLQSYKYLGSLLGLIFRIDKANRRKEYHTQEQNIYLGVLMCRTVVQTCFICLVNMIVFQCKKALFLPYSILCYSFLFCLENTSQSCMLPMYKYVMLCFVFICFLLFLFYVNHALFVL